MPNITKNINSSKQLPGFTLVELLIAVCVIAFGALVSVNMHITSLKGKNIAANMTYAGAIAETEMERLKTLPLADVMKMSSTEVTNLNQLSQACSPGPGNDCSQHIFTRRVNFYPKNPTSLSCHVEIEVDWKDSSGKHSILYSAVISTTALS
jgi:prepilin-type N-terminal cleavage/methylation domain-containing protein